MFPLRSSIPFRVPLHGVSSCSDVLKIVFSEALLIARILRRLSPSPSQINSYSLSPAAAFPGSLSSRLSLGSREMHSTVSRGVLTFRVVSETRLHSSDGAF